jgi:mannose-6-phosphate isomerase-like protein (cupin superfamily)
MKHYVQKFFCDKEDLPSWEEILNSLQNDIQEKREYRELKNFGFVLKNGHLLDKVEKIRLKIHKTKPEEPICTAHLFVSLTKFSQTFGKHKDTTDVYYIQALGNMQWNIEEENDIFNYELNEGDMIYIPKQLYHTPIPIGPRVGISIAFH